jgi:hypothetical protein
MQLAYRMTGVAEAGGRLCEGVNVVLCEFKEYAAAVGGHKAH